MAALTPQIIKQHDRTLRTIRRALEASEVTIKENGDYTNHYKKLSLGWHDMARMRGLCKAGARLNLRRLQKKSLRRSDCGIKI